MYEEATSLGTQARRRASADGRRARRPEPFGLGRTLVTHQGFGWLDVTVHGRAAYGSAPDQGIDAISPLARLIERLDELGAQWAAEPHPLNGATVYQQASCRAGSDYATYPASAKVGIEIGTQPGETIADRVAEIEGDRDRPHPGAAGVSRRGRRAARPRSVPGPGAIQRAASAVDQASVACSAAQPSQPA